MHWFFFLFLSQINSEKSNTLKDWPTHRESFHVVSQQQKKERKKNFLFFFLCVCFSFFYFSRSFVRSFLLPFWRGLVNQPTRPGISFVRARLFLSSCWLVWFLFWVEKPEKENPVVALVAPASAPQRGGRWEESFVIFNHHRWSLISQMYTQDEFIYFLSHLSSSLTKHNCAQPLLSSPDTFSFIDRPIFFLFSWIREKWIEGFRGERFFFFFSLPVSGSLPDPPATHRMSCVTCCVTTQGRMSHVIRAVSDRPWGFFVWNVRPMDPKWKKKINEEEEECSVCLFLK